MTPLNSARPPLSSVRPRPRAGFTRWILPWILPLAVASCATSGPAGGNTDEGESAAPAEGERDLDRLEEIYRERVERSRNRFVEADVEFMTGMIAHHAQALAMVAMVPERASSPRIQVLAERIRNSQVDEIALMERWLRARDIEPPEWQVEGHTLVLGEDVDAGGADAHAGGDAHARGTDAHAERTHRMPGMLSDEQMQELAAAAGERFDRLFLTYMVEHHRGAVVMVHELFGTDGAAQDPDVFRLASDIQVDQATEIARMERMLSAMPGGAAGP